MAARVAILIESQRLVADFMSYVCSGCDLIPYAYATCREGLIAIRSLQTAPVLLLVDIALPDGEGLALARIVRAESPDVKILAVSNERDEQTVNRAKECGLHGLFDKRGQGQHMLAEAITIVLGGHTYFPDPGAKIGRVSDPCSAGQPLISFA